MRRESALSRRVLGVLVGSTFLAILNETIISVALPTLIADLRISPVSAQWLSTGYMLTMAVVIPASGFIIRRFSTFQVFTGAMLLFILGTFVAALSPNFLFLLIARVMQAGGAAVMMPLVITTVVTNVPARRRGAVLGIVSIVIAAAPAIGPAVSGIILHFFSWHFLFWFTLPLAVALMVGGIVALPCKRSSENLTFDILSASVSVFAFGGIVLGISSIGEPNIGFPTWLPFLVGGIALSVFIGRQIQLQRADAAYLDLRTFRTPQFTLSVIGNACVSVTLFGTLSLIPLFLQDVRGMSSLETGLIMLPGGVLMAVASPFVGRLLDRLGPRAIVVPSALLVTASVFCFGITLTPTVPAAVVLGAFAVMHIGLAGLFTPLTAAAVSSLPISLYSYGVAALNTTQQLAAATGTASFIAMMTAVSASASGVSADGIRAAFLVGSGIALISVLLGLFLKPAIESGHRAR